jgi:signal transduction histidine kinase
VTILHDRAEAIEKALLYEQLKRASDELESKVREATAELLRKNELLQQQHLELEQSSALKSQFLANMSHEFRTPLTAILGYTSMLLQGVYGSVAGTQRKGLSRVDSNARHLLTIINDILDIARIEAGKMPLHLTRFAVGDVIAEVLSQLEPISARSHLAVSSEISSALPRVRSDHQKVKQILLNLLTNALKFTHQGWVKVTAAAVDGGSRIAVAVSDSGIGIAASDREKIFEDFQQGDNSPTREYGGTGLGLSICRRLARMISAEIQLHSEPGVGSTFTLVVPIKPPRAR